MAGPEMIGGDARGEGIARGGDPGGERRTPAGACRREGNGWIVAARVRKAGRCPAGADEGRESLSRLGHALLCLLESRPGVGHGLLGSGKRLGGRGSELRFGVEKPGLGPRGDERAFGPHGFPGGGRGGLGERVIRASPGEILGGPSGPHRGAAPLHGHEIGRGDRHSLLARHRGGGIAGGPGRFDAASSGSQMGVDHPRPPGRLRFGLWERYGADLYGREIEHGGDAGKDRPRRVGLRVLAADEQERRHIGDTVEHPWDPVAFEIGLARKDVEPGVERFEEGPHRVIVFLAERIVFVVVALGTVEREPEESLGDVLDRLVHPRGAVEEKPVAGEEPGGPQLGEIVGGDFVGGEHQPHHLVIAGVGVERFDDPVAPMPDVLLTVAELIPQAPPIGVAPHVHPVTPPALAMAGIGEKSIDEGLVPLGGSVGEDRGELLGLRGKAEEIEMEATDENLAGSFRLGGDPRPLPRCLEEGIDRIADSLRMGDARHRRADARPESPMLARVGLRDLVGRRRAAGGDPGFQGFDLLGRKGLPFPFRRHALGRVGVDDPRDERSGRRVAWDDDGAGITPGQEPRCGVEPQASLLGQGPVAGEAAIGEHLFERRAPSGGVSCGYRPAGDRGARQRHGQQCGVGGTGRCHGGSVRRATAGSGNHTSRAAGVSRRRSTDSRENGVATTPQRQDLARGCPCPGSRA